MGILHRPGVGRDSGFTLIELVIIIVVVGVLATVAVPVIGNMMETSRINATRQEMLLLKTAIVGRADSGVRGYENDVGSLPPTLQGLVIKPAGVTDYDRFTKTGWNGPYINTDNADYLKDAWGVNYLYDQGSRMLKSSGGPDTLTVAL
jgi:prepilin-type N-terminal cleavage/methylation domain-containing protein